LVVDRFHRAGETPRPSAEKRPGQMALVTVDDVLSRVEHWRTAYAPSTLATPPHVLRRPPAREAAVVGTTPSAPAMPWGLTAATNRA
jgi:hypothetical protein